MVTNGMYLVIAMLTENNFKFVVMQGIL